MSIAAESQSTAVIQLGYRNEKDVTKITFDITEWVTQYPEIICQLTVTDKENKCFAPGGQTQNGNALEWSLRRDVTGTEGDKEIVLRGVTDTVEKRSAIFRGYVKKSHSEPGTPPEEVQGWISDLMLKEGERRAAEAARAEAEVLRGTAEAVRQNNETDRNTAETVRGQNEQARGLGEQIRGFNEGQRLQRDLERGSAEQNRAQAEQARLQAELERISAEQGRAQAEQGRVSAELGRAQAEQAREQSANQAISAANTAAANADAKATAADTAASAANTAAANANTAAESANAIVNRINDLEADVQRIDWKTGVKKYIIRWDKISAQCTRMGDASAITTTITNFAHRGSLNPSYNNPFDALYPWSQRKLCKVNRAAYKTIHDAGGDILGAVTMWEGENGFALDGSGDFDGVYTPEFWGYIWQDATYVYAAVADGEVQGWTHFPAAIGGRYPGSLDANAKMTSIANSIAWRGSAMSTMHANAVTQGMTLDDIYTWAADTLLLCVEYATLNTQTAIGNGCDSLYSAGATGSEYRPGAAAALGATALIIPNALATALAVGGVIDVGTSNEDVNVCYVRTTSAPASLDAADPLYATHKSVAVTALPAAVTTAHYLALHGCYNAPDSDIGSKSGYIGTSGKCNAYYRGRVAHGNYWRYVLGAYRQTGTNRIWVAHSRAEANAYNAINTAVHRDTGLVLPTGAEGAAVSGYINSLLIDDDMPLVPFGGSIGGSSANPVGDYIYVPTPVTVNTVLIAGANANYGTAVGRFCGHWNGTAGNAAWFLAALPFLM